MRFLNIPRITNLSMLTRAFENQLHFVIKNMNVQKHRDRPLNGTETYPYMFLTA